MRAHGPSLDTIHSALRSTAFDLPVHHDERDLARACLLGAEVLGIQDPIGVCGSCMSGLLFFASSNRPLIPARASSDQCPVHRRNATWDRGRRRQRPER